MVTGWMMLDTNPGNALMRPPALVETDGAFRPSESQWAGFRFAKVEPIAFREERATDGRIAINEDTTTPVFSPYSGRVSRLIAKPGEHVERGAPLFAIEASEFVQGHNDLITAVAGVDKAKSRLALAQMAEKRQRDLQAIRGGALKDLEQAQSDLVQAQGDLRAAEITLAAVRNRLRILGRSDEDIADLEKRDRVGAETIVAAPIAGTVIQRKVGLGQYINAGANDPVYTIGDLSTVWLVANVRESDAPKMKVGAPVQVTVLAFPGQVFNAKLDYVAPALDPNTRRLPVRAAGQQSQPRAQARDVRLLPHRLGRGPVDACGAGRFDRLRRRQRPRLGGAARWQDGGVARHRRRRHQQRAGRGQEGAQCRRDRRDQRHAVHRSRRPSRLTTGPLHRAVIPCRPSSPTPSGNASW